MVRRIGLAFLWFLAAWTAAAMLALAMGIGAWLAPVVATTAAVAIFVLLGRQATTPATESAPAPSTAPGLEA